MIRQTQQCHHRNSSLASLARNDVRVWCHSERRFARGIPMIRRIQQLHHRDSSLASLARNNIRGGVIPSAVWREESL